MKTNKFWHHNSNLLSKFIEIYFSLVSYKYGLEYKNYPIYIKLENKEDYKNIIGDCYKQILHISSNNSYYGILRPEFTYIASKDINLNSNNLYYIGECYRNEKSQFLRYQKFTQLGCEMFATTLSKGLVVTCIMLAHLKEITKILEFNKNSNYVVFINTNNEFIINIVKSLYDNFELEINEIKRIGGIGGDEHNYTYFCFEIHAYDIEKKQQLHEIVGGGSYNINYKKNIIYSSGYAIGLERMLYYILNRQTEEEQKLLINYINNYHSRLNSKKTYYIDISNNADVFQKIQDIINNDNIMEYKLIK